MLQVKLFQNSTSSLTHPTQLVPLAAHQTIILNYQIHPVNRFYGHKLYTS